MSIESFCWDWISGAKILDELFTYSVKIYFSYFCFVSSHFIYFVCLFLLFLSLFSKILNEETFYYVAYSTNSFLIPLLFSIVLTVASGFYIGKLLIQMVINLFVWNPQQRSYTSKNNWKIDASIVAV